MAKAVIFIFLILIVLVLIIWNDCLLSKEEKLLIAINYGNGKAVKEYIDHGFDLNFKAARYIPSPTTEYIFEKIKTITNVEVRSKVSLPFIRKGETPLCRSIEFNEIKIFAMLLKAGADPNLKDDCKQQSPMNYSNSKKLDFALQIFGATYIPVEQSTCRTGISYPRCGLEDEYEFINIEDEEILTKLIEEKQTNSQ